MHSSWVCLLFHRAGSDPFPKILAASLVEISLHSDGAASAWRVTLAAEEPPMFRYRLRTLLIVLTIGPPLLAWDWFVGSSVMAELQAHQAGEWGSRGRNSGRSSPSLAAV
jgi:hypothetical protein